MSRVRAVIVLVCASAASLAHAEIALDQRKSGADFMSAATRAMQDDDTANPAMLSTLDGESLWTEKAGDAQKSCGDCHGPAPQSMKGVAARYPAYNVARKAPLDLSGQVNAARINRRRKPSSPRARSSSHCPPTSVCNHAACPFRLPMMRGLLHLARRARPCGASGLAS